MSELKKNTIIYFQSALFFVCLLIPVVEYIITFTGAGVNRLYFWCYMLMFLLLGLIFVVSDKKRLFIPVGILSAVLLIIIFRDRELTWNIAAALISVIIFTLIENEKISRFIWIVLASAELVLWIYTGNPSKIAASALLVSMIYSILRLTDIMYVYHAYLIILIGIVMVFLPSGEEPMQWKTLKSAVALVDGTVRGAFYETQYLFEGLSNVGGGYRGYSGNARLSGKVIGEGKDELILSSTKNNKCRYLTGAYYKTITKTGLKDKVETDSPYNMWFVEFINALYRAGIDDKEAACFSKMENMDIEYRYLRTEDVIIPEKPILIEEENQINSKKHGKGFQYSVSYMAIDYGSPYFLEVIEKGDGEYESYGTIKQYVKDIYGVNMDRFLSHEQYEEAVSYYSNRKSWINDYLDLSMQTPKIKELTEEVVQGLDGDYEKAKAIETYLRGYEYDTGVDLRKSDNYIESFLFETCSGYCVHYASAMVLMLRSCNIPARYVNGYMKPSDKNERTENLSGSYAHAWVEAYMPGTGWVRMEPTRVMKRAEGLTWGLEVKNDETSEVSGFDIEDEEYYKMMEERYRGSYGEPLNDLSKEASEKNNQKKDSDFYKELIIRFGRYILIMIVFMLSLFAIYKIIRTCIYIRMKPEDKLKENMKLLTKKLDRLLPEGEKTDSVMDYLGFIKDENVCADLQEIFDEYYKVRFRGDTASEELISRTRLSVKRIGQL